MAANRILHVATALALLSGCGTHSSVTSDETPPAEGHDEVSLTQVETTPQAPVFHWESESEEVWFLEFSPDDRRLIVMTAPEEEHHDYSVLVLDVETATEVYRTSAFHPLSACMSPDGSVLAILDYNGLTIHDLDDAEIVTLEETPPNVGDAIGFSADGSIVACGESRSIGELQCSAWYVETREEVATLDDPIAWHSRQISSDGTMGAYGGWPGPTPRIYRIDNGERVGFCFYEEWPIAATFMPNSHEYLTIHEDGKLIIWNLDEANDDNAPQLATSDGFHDIAALALTHDGNTIAVAGSDGVVRFEMLPPRGAN